MKYLMGLLLCLIASPLFAQAPTAPPLPWEMAPLIRALAPNVNVVVPLPLFSNYQRDRAGFTDAGFEASIKLSMQRVQVKQPAAAPFTPQTLPDPFENRQAIQLRQPLPELSDLPTYAAPPTGR